MPPHIEQKSGAEGVPSIEELRAVGQAWAPPAMPTPPPQSFTPPAWSPPGWSPPRRDKASPARRFLIGLAIFLLGLGVIGVLANLEGDPSTVRDGAGRNEAREPKNASPTAGMNADERFLYRHGSYYDCDPIARSSLLNGAIAGISCDASAGKNPVAQKVNYYRFEKHDALSNVYSSRLAALRASPGVRVVDEYGWCLTSFSLACFSPDGRTVFYEKGGTVHAEWTYHPRKTYSTAVRRDDKMGKLRTLWRDAGPD